MCRVAKTHRMSYFDMSFSAKEPYDQGLFCGKRPATYGISCIFATLHQVVILVTYGDI